jgi:hypothetical protein
MEPIPETADAASELGPFDESDLLEPLQDKAEPLREAVPAHVGPSLPLNEHGVSITLIATDTEIATPDGVQYPTGGPCVEGVKAEQVLECARCSAAGGPHSPWSTPSTNPADGGIPSGSGPLLHPAPPGNR